MHRSRVRRISRQMSDTVIGGLIMFQFTGIVTDFVPPGESHTAILHLDNPKSDSHRVSLALDGASEADIEAYAQTPGCICSIVSSSFVIPSDAKRAHSYAGAKCKNPDGSLSSVLVPRPTGREFFISAGVLDSDPKFARPLVNASTVAAAIRAALA